MTVDRSQTGATYEIEVLGQLDREWEAWLDGLALTLNPAGEGSGTTTLVGPVSDQAALRGLLCRLWDLNLTLISVRRVAVFGKDECQNA